MEHQDEDKTGRRINVSVEILEERLKNWADDVKRNQDTVLNELRRLSDRYDNQLGGFELWRAQHEIQSTYIQADMAQAKLDIAALQEAKKALADLTTLKEAVKNMQEAKKEGQVAQDAKISLLKTQWSWLVAGAFGASAFLGVLSQSGVIHIGSK